MKSKNLAEIQAELQAAICEGTLPLSLIDFILEKPPITVAERLKIYQDAYFTRLQESLSEDFTRVADLMGDDPFSDLVAQFIKAHPPRGFSLSEYSEGFVDFIKTVYPPAFEATAKDWLQILTQTAAEPSRALTAHQIQSGVPFSIHLHPAVNFRQIESTHHLVSFRSPSQVDFFVITEESFELPLLLFFKEPRHLQDVGAFAAQLKVSEAKLMQTIGDWMKSSILYCKEVSQ